jgi:feruloyl esterase
VNVDANGKVILGPEKMPVLHQAALESCDAVDGLKDGLIADPRACRFDPGVTQCKPGQDPSTCLSAEQVEVARKIYQGAHDADGRKLTISGPQVGSELGWPGVQVPRAEGGQDIGSRNFATEVVCGLAQDKPPSGSCSVNDLGFDAQSFEKLKALHGVYDATDPDLSRFERGGGKLILWHGWADQHISPLNSIAYYRAMRDVMGEEKVKTFARLYLFPGGSHCRGGEGPFNVDLMSAIMAWVETGRAPHELIAYHTAGGEARPGGEGGPRGEGSPTLARAPGLLPPTEGKVDRSRPVFPYPLVARYAGKGSIDDAASFVEAMPERQLPETFEWYGSSFFAPGSQRW